MNFRLQLFCLAPSVGTPACGNAVYGTLITSGCRQMKCFVWGLYTSPTTICWVNAKIIGSELLAAEPAGSG
jgi:hypothetical protein